jgi:hypothetical protein
MTIIEISLVKGQFSPYTHYGNHLLQLGTIEYFLTTKKINKEFLIEQIVNQSQ